MRKSAFAAYFVDVSAKLAGSGRAAVHHRFIAILKLSFKFSPEYRRTRQGQDARPGNGDANGQSGAWIGREK
jgi:hypothetical protein